MSSTDSKKADAALRQFFERQLLPLSEQLARQGRAYFPAKAEPAAATYYVSRARTTMSRADFDVPGTESTETFEKAMVDLWRSQGHEELVPLAASLAQLAGLLHQRVEQSDEVSPLIYVMF